MPNSSYEMQPDHASLPAHATSLRPAPLLARALGLAFRLLYNELAWAYEAVAWVVSLGDWALWRQCAIPFLLPGTVLEIGQGTGALAVQLAEQGWHVVALDPSPNMARIAQRRLRRHHQHTSLASRLVFLRATAFKLPLAARRFDNLVSAFPTEYILRTECIQEGLRVIRPGGRWVIVPVAQPAPWGMLRRFSARLFEETGQAPPWDAPLASVLRSNGFGVHQEIVSLGRSFVHVTVAVRHSEPYC